MVYRTIFFNNHLYDYFTLCSFLLRCYGIFYVACQILQAGYHTSGEFRHIVCYLVYGVFSDKK